MEETTSGIVGRRQSFGLTSKERQEWEEQGYVVREAVFTPEECRALGQVAEDLALGRRPFPAAHRDVNAKVREGEVQGVEGIATMHKIHFPHLYCREFLDRVRDPRLTDPAADILGADVLGINTLFIFKAPRLGIGFPWHQDKYYFSKNFVTETTVGTWQAIDEATVDNGCLWVIPGSHRRRIAEHDRQTGAQQSEFLLARNTDDSQGVAVEMKPGSVLWFHSHLLHKSVDNHSGVFRRCYVAHYLSARARYVTPGKVGQPVMWICGQTYPDCVQADTRDVLPVV